ncbi:fimbrial protein [Dyella subtropica]|uniref:fimbrial protein n=1 Tax=Dyella subtropica TaxID=2992127 RepID=UPI002252C661|nr:fimbrial protein [Dyella subtropica]
MKNTYVFANICSGQRRWVAALLAAGMALASSAAFAQSSGNATINVTGTITGATCSLSTSNITIPIGTVDKSVFTHIGSFSAWAPNQSLISSGCDASLVSMTFTGTPAPGNADLFAVTGGAAGVGIQLQKNNTNGGPGGGQAIPNSTTYPVTFTPAASGGGYGFSARYVQTADKITTGPANATITVLITYI